MTETKKQRHELEITSIEAVSYSQNGLGKRVHLGVRITAKDLSDGEYTFNVTGDEASRMCVGMVIAVERTWTETKS